MNHMLSAFSAPLGSMSAFLVPKKRHQMDGVTQALMAAVAAAATQVALFHIFKGFIQLLRFL